MTETAVQSTAAAAKAGPSARSALLVAAVFAVVHLIVAFRAELVPDEAYYWVWSRYLTAGYYDHPPMVALWAAAGTRLFGDSAVAIRLLTVLTGPLISLVIYATARTLFEAPAIAARAVIWFNVTLLVALGGFMVTPDAPSTLFWALAIYGLAKAATTGNGRWWLAVGLLAGLGAASKYTNLFLGVGIGLWLLFDRPARRWLATPWPYAAGAIAVAAFLPVLIWNADHGWISFEKQFGRIAPVELQPATVLEFIAAQAILLNPFIAVLLVAAVVRFEKAGIWQGGGTLLLLTSAPLVAYMAFHSFHARVEGNWLIPIYPALVLLASASAEHDMAPWLQWFRRAVVPFGLVCAAVGLFVIATPINPILVKIESPRFVGWNELAAEVEREMAANKATWLATTLYTTTGELTFHMPQVRVIQINERNRYSFQPVPSLPEGPAILIAARQQTGADRCFASIRPLSVFTLPGSNPDKGYVLSLAEGPVADLLERGCSITMPGPG